MREKLIKLIKQNPYAPTPDSLADHLLANGVIVVPDNNIGKWIPVTEPPKEWRDENGKLVNYLVYMPEYGVDIGNYMSPAKCWVCMGIPCNVTHWMPLPQPPKEGE